MDWTRNNLDRAASPYLRQHQDNPIWWQEWEKNILTEATEHNKIIFVSVGYATCHWCHMMAEETFSNQEVADYLNEHFLSVKIDREQRPDIDAYLMSYMTSLTGKGGWPLNAFLTPDLKPLFATTYLPPKSSEQTIGFLQMLQKIKSFYDHKRSEIQPFSPPFEYPEQKHRGHDIVDSYVRSYDPQFGGFGFHHKFPPHCSLLFLLYYYEITQNSDIQPILQTTLEKMMLRGLHDHLQGGFFRYCVDRTWTIPHFEKMLYDQALALWTFCLAYHIFTDSAYQTVAHKIIQCLEESFKINGGAYVSAHDADTDQQEGGTYLWRKEELQEILTKDEYARFSAIYDLPAEGHMHGKIHLIKKQAVFLPEIESKLLQYRRHRPQPFVDKKIITSWNCFAGIAFIHAYRYLPGQIRCLKKAEKIAAYLLNTHYMNGVVFHSSCDGDLQDEALFLEDAGGLLLFLTYLYEETGANKDTIDKLADQLNLFHQNGAWIESRNDDFIQVPASVLDYPTPSATALVELALTRKNTLLNGFPPRADFKTPLLYDFRNISVLIKNGLFHIRETPEKTNWRRLNINTIQKTGNESKDCYQGVCQPVQR